MMRSDANVSDAPLRQVLVVEDDSHTLNYISEGLEQAGWRVQGANDGSHGLQLATDTNFDVVVVDRLLPGMDGLSMVRHMRERRIETPAIMLTALGAVSDRIAGLVHSDDYLVKPFSLEELNARISALARRPVLGAPERTVLEIEDVTLERIRRTVEQDGKLIDLLPMEYRLLEFLMLRWGQSFTRTMLLEQVWGFNFDPRTNIVETHICRLRSKITMRGNNPLIATVRGAGYVVRGPVRGHF